MKSLSERLLDAAVVFDEPHATLLREAAAATKERRKGDRRALPEPPEPADREDDAALIEKLGALLSGVAVALKGPEKPLHRHSYHDLPQIAQELKLAYDIAEAMLASDRERIIKVCEDYAERCARNKDVMMPGEARVRWHERHQASLWLLNAIRALKTIPSQTTQRDPHVDLYSFDRSKINEFQRQTMGAVLKACKHAHYTNIILRINGRDDVYEADWLKHFVLAAHPEPQQPREGE